MWLITLNGGDVFWSLHQLLTLSLWRCRSRRACVPACVHPHACVWTCMNTYAQACMCACTCICACARVRVHAHAYACACMCTPMYRWRVLVAAPQRVGRCLGRAYVHTWARMCTVYSECYMHFGTDVLGTSAWEGVQLHRRVFTPTYTSVAHSLQAVHMCVYVYMCVYGCVCVRMRVCVYDIT